MQGLLNFDDEAGCKTAFQRKDHLWTLPEWEQGRFQMPLSRESCMLARVRFVPWPYHGLVAAFLE